MITPFGWLERVPTFKEQQEELQDRDLNTYGFLGYPLLQTADVVLYSATRCRSGRTRSRTWSWRGRSCAGSTTTTARWQPVLVEPHATLHGAQGLGHRRPQDEEVLRQRI